MASEITPIVEQDPTEQIVVLRTDLEQWAQVMRWAHGYAAAMDLAEGYRATRANGKNSKLTTTIAQSHNKILGYIEEEDVPTD